MRNETPLNSENGKPAVAVEKTGTRVLSVDVLRGFDMFWLAGGTGLALGILRLFHGPWAEALIRQCEHVEWEGFRFYDFIFPLFLFVVGMSVVFSLGKIVEQQGRWAAYKRIFRRFALMYLMGVFCSGGMSSAWPDIRLLGVLQRLALGYLFAGILFCHLKPKGLVAVCIGLLLGYWAFLSFVPVPDIGRVSFAAGENWSNYLDKLYLPGRKYDGDWDPEGLLSTLPAIGTCLLGVFASLLLGEKSISGKKKVAWFIGGGLLLVIAGYLWGLQFPIIKKIWTSSYVLVAGGYSYMLLGLFFLIVDVWGFQKWAQPFIWFGANPLTIYMARNIVDFNDVANRFVGGSIAGRFSEDGAYCLRMAVSLALSVLLVRFLYRRKIFLRV